jgi:hypothetical protein
MKYRLVRLICVVAFGLFGTVALAQSYHQLTPADFQGMPPRAAQSTIAYTNCSIDFRYQAHRRQDYYSLDFNIQLTMNNYKSWLDKSRVTSQQMMTEILKHEQGHYNIAYMEQQELLRAVSRTIFHADYQAAAANLFNRIDAKYKQLNADYDADTQHMQNRTQQQSWDAYFKKKIEFMPPQ